MQAVGAVLLPLLRALVEQAVAVLVHLEQTQQQRELQTLAAVAVAQEIAQIAVQFLVVLAALVLSSCPTPCQKAQQLNSSLLRHGKPQQASLPLTIWW